MKKLLGVLMVALVALSSFAFSYKKCKVENDLLLEIFKGIFREPMEVIYIWTNDFTMYSVTSNSETGVFFRMEDIKKVLRKNGHTISDIILIVHNHMPLTGYRLFDFSMDDIDTWRGFKEEGFKGMFYIYVQGMNRIYKLTEDDDNCKKIANLGGLS